MSKQFAPPPRPPGKHASAVQQHPVPRPPAPPLRICAVAPPPLAARPAAAGSAQRFAAFANRTVDRGERKAPPGDELVALSNDNFGARNPDRGLVTRPDGTYNFVRTQGLRRMDQRTLISAKAGHAQLAHGKPVIYAGTMRFSGGALDWWSNYSGHYQPIAAFRGQAQLPDDKFVPWQKLQMGGTAMQRGMFRDRRPTGAPAAKAQPDEKKAERGAEAQPAAAARPEKPSAASGAAPSGAGPVAKAGS